MPTEFDYMEYSSDALAQAAYVSSEAYGADVLSGGFASASIEYYPASNACDNDVGTKWGTGGKTTPQWWKYDFGSGHAKIIQKVRFLENYAIRDFKIQGSNNDSDWDDIYTGEAPNWTETGWKECTFTNFAAYRYYRIYIVSGGIVNVYMDEIEMMEASFQCYSEDTIKQEGSYALKTLAHQTSSYNETLTRTVSPTIDLSGQVTIKVDVRASRTGSNFKICIHDSGGTTTEHTVNIATADTWQTETWDISGVSGANKDAIDQIIITILNADADNVIYIDYLSTTVVYFTGGSTAQSSVSANLSSIWACASAIAAQASVSGDLAVGLDLIGTTIAAQSAVSGDLKVDIVYLSGNIAAQSSVSGELILIILQIEGTTIAAQSSCNGNLDKYTMIDLVGTTIAASSSVSATEFEMCELFRAFNFEIEPTISTGKGQIPTVTLRVSNATRLLEPYLKQFDGGVKSSVEIMVINSERLSEDYNELKQIFEVLACNNKAKWITFTLGRPSLLRRRFPLQKYLALHCSYKYNDVDGQDGFRCQYTGKAVTGITKATNAKISCAGHSFAVDDAIKFADVGGMTEINGEIGIVVNADPDADGNALTVDIDSEAFTAYTSGGKCGYATCNKTLIECRERSNSPNFGGVPGIRSGTVRVA